MNENSLELFSLLSDTPQVSKEEMQNAYKHFTEQIIAISQSEQSYHEIFRKLNITRIEFDSLKSSSFYELKKNELKKVYQRKVMMLRIFLFITFRISCRTTSSARYRSRRNCSSASCKQSLTRWRKTSKCYGSRERTCRGRC